MWSRVDDWNLERDELADRHVDTSNLGKCVRRLHSVGRAHAHGLPGCSSQAVICSACGSLGSIRWWTRTVTAVPLFCFAVRSTGQASQPPVLKGGPWCWAQHTRPGLSSWSRPGSSANPSLAFWLPSIAGGIFSVTQSNITGNGRPQQHIVFKNQRSGAALWRVG